MARFTVRLTAPIPPQEAWRRIWDLDAHTHAIPLTRLSGDGTLGRPLFPGARFVARTGLGPVGFDDVMEVRQFDAPESGRDGTATIGKTGRVVRGGIAAVVSGTPERADLVWRQEIHLPWVPRLLDPVVAKIAAAAYTRVLQRLLHD